MNEIRLPSPEVEVMLWGLIWGSEALLIVRAHLHLKFTQREVRFDWQHDGGAGRGGAGE